MPKISVIMPVYNVEYCLETAINSILTQKLEDLEIILVNDGSKDRSGAICDEYVKKDSRVRAIHKENEGAGPTRNVGISIATGEYISFIDSDDEYSNNMLSTAYEAAYKNNADLVVFALKRKIINSKSGKVKSETNSTQIYKIYRENVGFAKDFLNLYPAALFGGPCNKLFKTDVVKNKKVSFPSLRRGQDELFNFEYYKWAERVVIIPDVMYYYNAYDDTSFWKKYNPTYFDTTIKYQKKIVELFKFWGLYDNEYKEFCNISLLGSLQYAILMCHNPGLNIKNTERIEYVKRFVSNEYIISRFEEMESRDERSRQIISMVLNKESEKLFKLAFKEYKNEKLIRTLKSRNPRLLSIMVRMKHFIKR